MASIQKYTPNPNGELISFSTALKHVTGALATRWLSPELWAQVARGAIAFGIILANVLALAGFVFSVPLLAFLFKKSQALRIEQAAQASAAFRAQFTPAVAHRKPAKAKKPHSRKAGR